MKRKKVLEGEVVSDKMEKTIVVRVTRRFKHPLLGKTVQKSKKYKVHDEQGEAHVGDWVEIAPVKDVTLNLSAATWDATTRDSNRWRQSIQTLLEATIEFQILWLPDDDIFSDLLTKFIDGCPMAFIALDAVYDWVMGYLESTRCGDTVYKATGLMADCTVTSFSRGEPLEEGVVADVTLMPTIGQIYPEWIEIIGT